MFLLDGMFAMDGAEPGSLWRKDRMREDWAPVEAQICFLAQQLISLGSAKIQQRQTHFE